MSKYSYEFKKEVVQAYLNREESYDCIAKQYEIPSSTTLKSWVSAYKEFGEEGLFRSREKKNYSFEFKLHVVELYLTTEVSYQELALSVGMNNPPLISKWVNDFRIACPDALRPKLKGRRPTMSKPKNNKSASIDNISIDAQYLKQLEDENLKLRIENAYLKELRRLRLEDETRQRERLASFTVTEENSN